MTKKQALSLLKKIEKKLKDFSPALYGSISFDVIDDYNGQHGNRSYCYALNTYKRTWIYINLRSIETFDDFVQSVAHELSHALCIHFEHYNDVITKLIPDSSIASMHTLFNQVSESFVDDASEFIEFWIKSTLQSKKTAASK